MPPVLALRPPQAFTLLRLRCSCLQRRGRMGNAASRILGSATAMPAQEGTWLIVGLGNPGNNYADTRHNIGFAVVDGLAQKHGISVRKVEHTAAVGKGMVGSTPVVLAKPLTFMNNSGEAVGRLARYYKVPASCVLAVCDDLDLPLGKVRLRAKGGHGGHNGLRSIAAHMQGTEYPRIKLGIGRPPGRTPVAAFVLQRFTKAEQEEVQFAVQDACDTIEAVLQLGMEKSLSGVRL